MKAAYFDLPLELFNSGVTVFVNYDAKRLVSFHRKDPPELRKEIDVLATWWHQAMSKATRGCVSSNSAGVITLLSLKGLDRAGVMMVVAHEMLHASVEVMKGACIPISKDTEEVQAYLVGHLTSRVMRGIDRWCVKRRPMAPSR